MEKGIYRHFKGKYYEVIDIAIHSETLEEYVVYRQLYGTKKTWIRLKSMFEEKVLYNNQLVSRFEFVSCINTNVEEFDSSLQ